MTIGVPEPAQPPKQEPQNKDQESEKTGHLKGGFPESLEGLVFISRDSGVFGQIFSCLKQGWEFLGDEEKVNLEKYTINILHAVQNYKERCEGLERVSLMRLDDPKIREGVARVDAMRHTAHNVLVDSLNILSRQMKEMGINNNWRANNAIYDPSPEGMREKISIWAQKLDLGISDKA